MRIALISITLLSSLFLFSCKENKSNLQLQEISSKELIIDFDKYEFYKGTVYYEKDGIVYDFYINKNDSTLVGRSMEEEVESPKYIFPIDNYENLLIYNIQNDTIIFHYKNELVTLSTFDNNKQILKLPIDTSLYGVLYGLNNKSILDNNIIYFGISSSTSPTFIDTFQTLVFDLNTNSLSKIGVFPEKFKNQEYYFRDAQQYKTPDNIFLVFQKCDSVLYYDKKNLDREAENYIPIFTDLSRVADTPYDNTKARDMEYVMKYATTSEVNVPVFQKQDSDQLYVVKRLYKAKRADKDQYVLGKIKDKKYVGYCHLPDDYNVAAQFIKNDTLYYLSLLNNKTTWKGFKISER